MGKTRNPAAAAARRRGLDEAAPRVVREAVPVTITYRAPGSAAVQRHAAYKLPGERLPAWDRLAASGRLHPQHAANLVALAHLWHLARQPDVTADYGPTRGGLEVPDDLPTALDHWRALLRTLPPRALPVLLALLVDDRVPDPTQLPCLVMALDRLDHLTREWDGQMWSVEE